MIRTEKYSVKHEKVHVDLATTIFLCIVFTDELVNGHRAGEACQLVDVLCERNHVTTTPNLKEKCNYGRD
ncbi:hypothetical protein J6590_077740 [Homalodisca vitripennis]|nr:hypothetical protein J6590_077740 [Homalodisca vitripennis]